MPRCSRNWPFSSTEKPLPMRGNSSAKGSCADGRVKLVTKVAERFAAGTHGELAVHALDVGLHGRHHDVQQIGHFLAGVVP